MEKFEYNFDFGPKPAIVSDAWFKKALLPIGTLVVCAFLLGTLSHYWFTRFIIPSIAAGALIIFVGLYLYRRQLAIRRIEGTKSAIFHYKIDDSGIHFDNEIGTGTIKWGFKGKLIPSKRFILLQSPEMGLIPIPAETPPEVLQGIKSKLRK